MKVYVITREVSIPMDGTETRVIGVVSKENEAKRIVEELKKNPYVEDCARTEYDYDVYDIDTIPTCNLWDAEKNIKL